MKKVRITLELDEHFVRMLNANVSLANKQRFDPIHVLALITNLESRGATEEQIHHLVPIEWREHIQCIHDERKVIE